MKLLKMEEELTRSKRMQEELYQEIDSIANANDNWQERNISLTKQASKAVLSVLARRSEPKAYEADAGNIEGDCS